MPPPESQKLLNHGFPFFRDGLRSMPGQAVSTPGVEGRAGTAGGFQSDSSLSLPKGAADKAQVDLVSQQPVIAPIAKGQVGTARSS